MTNNLVSQVTCERTYFGKDICSELLEDHFYVEMFCRFTGSRLVNFGFTDEHFPLVEMTYYFNDGLGGYTIKRIYNSLRFRTSI